MKASLNVLKSLVDIEGLSAKEIAEKLTFAGVEVESISRLATGEGLIIGQVLECEKMKDSDHLHVCKVNMGPELGIHQIVCGAPNVAKGEKVIVAKDGAKLPGGVIKKGEIRGVTSDGMLCSLHELGVDDKYLSEKEKEGIALLDKNAVVGNENVLSYLGLDDAILELKILANRSDLMSLENIAKEIALLFDRKLLLKKYDVASEIKNDFVVSSASKYCPQFSIRLVKGIKVAESPKWLKDALRSSGVRSINNIVDIGNYVMLITGQPIHMYDMDKLPSHELIVKDDLQGEFIAQDEKSYNIQKDDLVVTSSNKAMCLGGVMGSFSSMVDEHSKNIAIESANFDYAHIRRTSNRLGLASESSNRFSKGINPNQYVNVLNMAASLVNELCGPSSISDIKTYDVLDHKPVVVHTSIGKINSRLGTSFNKEEIISILKKDYLGVKSNNDELEIVVPSSRIDITCDADISEEVVRLLGFNNVKVELPKLDASIGKMSDSYAKKRLIRDYLKDAGLDEVITYSLLKQNEVNKMAIISHNEPYKIINPMTDEHEYMRINLIHSLLLVASYNLAHQTSNLHFFEVSDIFSLKGNDVRLGIVLLGNEEYQHKMHDIPYSFYHMKGYLEGLMHALGLEENRYSIVKNDKYVNELHPGKSAFIRFGKDIIGYLGELHPTKMKEYDLGKTNAIIMEVNLSALFEAKTSLKKFVEFSRFPSVNRDLALLINRDISSKDVISLVKKCDRNLIKEVEVFDEYCDDKLQSANKKSLAINIVFSSNDETLKDAVVVALEEKIIKTLEQELHAELRK